MSNQANFNKKLLHLRHLANAGLYVFDCKNAKRTSFSAASGNSRHR